MSASKPRASMFPLPSLDPPLPPYSRSRRCSQRYSRAVATTSSANCAIRALNQLSTSFSSSADPLLPSSHDSLTEPETVSHPSSPCTNTASSSPSPSAAQCRAVAHVYRCASRFVSRRETLGSECDDLSSSVLDQLPFAAQHMQYSDLDSSINPYISSSAAATVVPLIADRISLPSSAGSVDLLSLLLR